MLRGILAAACAVGLISVSTATATDIHQGPITVKNDFDVEIIVTVYHADDIDEPFESYKIKAGKSLQLEHRGKPCIIGGDWPVKVEPAGKEAPKRRLLWKVSEFKDGAFTVHAKVAYAGKKPLPDAA